ncbi:putative GMC oxidoreductase [Hypoxylon crocopeplum]|nr:putative GMC oxidoreductase [Hypoxylon crocopeplum]
MHRLISLVTFFATTAAAIFLEADSEGIIDNADYLIVGGGPAGMVLAERLSRDPNHRVVLLEAGPDTFNSTLQNTPAYFPFITDDAVWDYTTQPDASLAGTTVSMRQGRAVGGGTAVNGMAYCRGAASVFDEWATISGNDGLAWESFFQDFLDVSHYVDDPNSEYEQVIDTAAYGNGPLEVSRGGGLSGFEIPFARAIEQELGIHEVDMNDGTGIGIDRGVATIFAGNRTRSYGRTAFGPLMASRVNVQIVYGAWVSKIGFASNRAVNVTYQSKGNARTISAREIILSGGAINTPKLLMLSGVGPRDQLESLGIPVVADRPEIGSNLRDHGVSIVQLLVTPEVLTYWQWSANSTEESLAREQYATNGTGPLGWAEGFIYATFRIPDSVWEGLNDTHYNSLPRDRPHAMIQYASIPFIASVNSSSVTAWAALVQPASSGRVTLQSSEYRDAPLIHTNYYGTKADRAAMLWTYKKLREILNQDPVRQLIVEEFYPGSAVTTDDDIWAAIQKQTLSFFHPVGTVALGSALDSDWRLRGLEGIRVVDTSAFPFPTTCHPQAVVYALGNRASKDILEAD